MPALRRAVQSDFEALYSIWMQDHCIPFMTFERLPKEEFKRVFAAFMLRCEVYVLEDLGEIVATLRIIPGSEEHAHSVEIASFAVSKDHLGKGNGRDIKQQVIDKIKQEKPEIKRFELGQETDNEIAFNLANKMGFEIEMVLPDWLRRKTGPKEFTNKWHVAARFMVLVDPVVKAQSISNVEKFYPALPTLLLGEIECADIELNTKQGVGRFSHIQFWNIKLKLSDDLLVAEKFLRKQAIAAAECCKKIEIYTADSNVLQLAQRLGFHCRGKRIAACKIDDKYYDEICVDLSFFNIQDTDEIVDIYVENKLLKENIRTALAVCEVNIAALLREQKIGTYAQLYLENMAFQMIRENIGEPALRCYGNQGQCLAPWDDLIEQLPGSLKNAFLQLTEQIKICKKKTSTAI